MNIRESWIRTWGGFLGGSSGSIQTPSADPASKYISAAGITDSGEIAAVTQLFDDISGGGDTTNNTDILSGLYAMYIVSPTSLAAASVNAANPNTHDLTLYNSPTLDVTGLSFNGTNQYADTNLSPDSTITLADSSHTFYANDITYGNGYPTGTLTGGNQYGLTRATLSGLFQMFSGGKSVAEASSPVKIFTETRSSTTDQRMYSNGIAGDTDFTATTMTLPTNNIYIGGFNNGSDVMAGAEEFELCFDAWGAALSADQAEDFAEAIVKYRASIQTETLITDVDAARYIMEGGITDMDEALSLNVMYIDLKAEGIFDKLYGLWAASPTGGLAASAINVKEPLGTQVTWFNSPTITNAGIQGNNVNMYGDTGISMLDTSTEGTIGAMLMTQNANANCSIGALKNGAPYDGGMLYAASTADHSSMGTYTGSSTAATDRIGLMTVSNDNGTMYKRKDGVLIYSGAQAVGTAQAKNWYLMARNYASVNYDNKLTTFWFVSEYLTAAEEATLSGIMEEFNTDARDDVDVVAWVAAGSVTDETEIDAVDQFVRDLKGIGDTTNNTDIWSDLHWINIVSATSLAASLNDLKGNYNLTAYNSPTWANTGITGNGSNMRLETSFVNSTDGGDVNSNSFGIFLTNTTTRNKQSYMGGRSGTAYNVMNYDNVRYFGNQSNYQSTALGSFDDGFWICNRESSASYDVTKNNSLVLLRNTVSSSQPTAVMALLVQNSSGTLYNHSDATFQVAFEGLGLTDDQMVDFHEAVATLNANIIDGGR